MSTRAFTNVLKSFADEVERSFGFLAVDFGMSGPDRQTVVIPAVAFVGSGLEYRVRLDTDDQAVVTRVEMDLDEVKLIAELGSLVSAAGLGSANQVACNAHNLHNLRRSLESQAGFVRQLHPLVTGIDAQSLMLKAGARQWRV